MTTDQIQKNVKLGQLAATFMQLIDGEIAALPPDDQQRVWQRLFEVKGAVPAAVAKDAELSYDEARRWAEKEKLVFGKYAGQRMCDVPADYLEWLVSQPDFRSSLERYMRSSYYQDVHSK